MTETTIKYAKPDEQYLHIVQYPERLETKYLFEIETITINNIKRCVTSDVLVKGGDPAVSEEDAYKEIRESFDYFKEDLGVDIVQNPKLISVKEGKYSTTDDVGLFKQLLIDAVKDKTKKNHKSAKKQMKKMYPEIAKEMGVA